MSIFAARYSSPLPTEVRESSFDAIAPSSRAFHEVYDLSLFASSIFLLTERFQIGLGDGDGGMSHRFGDNARMDFTVIRCRSPAYGGRCTNSTYPASPTNFT